MKKIYLEPAMEIVEIATKQILMISGPDIISDDPTGTSEGVDNPSDILAPNLPGMPGVPGAPGMPNLFE